MAWLLFSHIKINNGNRNRILNNSGFAFASAISFQSILLYTNKYLPFVLSKANLMARFLSGQLKCGS